MLCRHECFSGTVDIGAGIGCLKMNFEYFIGCISDFSEDFGPVK